MTDDPSRAAVNPAVTAVGLRAAARLAAREHGVVAVTADGCGALEAEADRRCIAAERARAEERGLADRVTVAREEREARQRAVEEAAAASDPAAIRTWRRRARSAFQARQLAARGSEEIAAAAADWLSEVERLNAVAAQTSGRLERERAAEEIAIATLEHLVAESEAARRAAESAQAACVAARAAAEACAEARRQAAGPRAGRGPAPADADRLRVAAIGALPSTPAAQLERRVEPADRPGGTAERPPSQAGSTKAPNPVPVATPAQPIAAPATSGDAVSSEPADEIPAGQPDRIGSAAVVRRILAGDLGQLARVADQLSRDPAERRRWESRLTALFDAILVRAIDAGAIQLPHDHAFWGAFTSEQARDIMAALAALGYRFDGLGGWLDERVPGQRDLSIAVAHAGLDPMRTRRWPGGEEAAALVRDAQVLGDEYLVSVAPAFTVRELRSILGPEAQELEDVWATWDRIRPLLIAPDAPAAASGAPGGSP